MQYGADGDYNRVRSIGPRIHSSDDHTMAPYHKCTLSASGFVAINLNRGFRLAITDPSSRSNLFIDYGDIRLGHLECSPDGVYFAVYTNNRILGIF